MMNSDREFVDRVRSAAEIGRTIGEYVRLRKAGRRLVGLCPFHAEKTPSFSVDEQKQLFHCFGCGAGGDVFKFMMLYEKIDFREALEALAEKHGIEVPRRVRSETAPRGIKERLLEANGAAAAWFRAQLAEPRAGLAGRAYLDGRGLGAATIERLGLGYAPREWDALKRHLLSRGFTQDELVASGLAVMRADGSGSYDRFRERIIFPIVSAGGRIVGFGGRAIAPPAELGNRPKYLNSPETPVYSKSDTLYGLYPAEGERGEGGPGRGEMDRVGGRHERRLIGPRCRGGRGDPRASPAKASVRNVRPSAAG
jgi:DNA primase